MGRHHQLLLLLERIRQRKQQHDDEITQQVDDIIDDNNSYISTTSTITLSSVRKCRLRNIQQRRKRQKTRTAIIGVLLLVVSAVVWISHFKPKQHYIEQQQQHHHRNRHRHRRHSDRYYYDVDDDDNNEDYYDDDDDYYYNPYYSSRSSSSSSSSYSSRHVSYRKLKTSVQQHSLVRFVDQMGGLQSLCETPYAIQLVDTVCHQNSNNNDHDLSSPLLFPILVDTTSKDKKNNMIATNNLAEYNGKTRITHHPNDQLLRKLEDAASFPPPTETNDGIDDIGEKPKKKRKHGKESRRRNELSPNMWLAVNIIGSVVCVGAIALFSCMFLGFMTLDPLDLRIKIRASMDPEERDFASKLLPIVEDRHRLLVTLLLMDALFYETLPLFLDNLLPSWAAVLMSVTFLLVFGEIIPSAIYTGPEQLKLASQLTPLMRFFLWFFRPLAAPLIWLLDALVPAEDPDEEAYNRGELSALVRIQYEERQAHNAPRAAVNFTGLVPATGQIKGQNHPSQQHRPSTVGPMKGPNNTLIVTDKSRGWRSLKREIMEAVEQRHSDSHLTSGASSTSSPSHYHHHHHHSNGHTHHNNHYQDRSHRRTRDLSIGSDMDSVHSSSTAPAYEQFAPPLHYAEVKMVEGALTMKTKCAWDVYTPLRKIFAVPHDLELDRDTIAEIYSEGYSRVPVYERLPPPNEHRQYAMRGILMTRQLIMIDWADDRPVESLPLYQPPCVSPRMNLVDLLQLLQTGGSHIAFVCAGPDLATQALEDDKPIPIEAGFMGLVTLEDVLEAILQERIYDEEDVSDRDLASAKLTQWAAKILQRFYRKRVLVKQQQQQSTGTGTGTTIDTTSSLLPQKHALATSTNLASSLEQQRSKPLLPPSSSIPEEIDLELAIASDHSNSSNNIGGDGAGPTENTPLLRNTSTLSTSLRNKNES